MARLPVGYRSPFNKISSIKQSPLKLAPSLRSFSSCSPGLIQAGASLFGRKARRDEQEAADLEMKNAKQAFMDIEYKNPYADLKNPYAGMENVYEDATVDIQGCRLLKTTTTTIFSNTMQGLKGVAGSSGVAGISTIKWLIYLRGKHKASANIAQQERVNQQRSMAEASRLDQLKTKKKRSITEVEIAKI